MRRWVFAAAFALACASATACSSDPGAAANAPAEATATAAVPAAVVSADTHSPIEVAGNEAMPRTIDSVPRDVLSRLEHKQAMIIFYYDSTELATQDQRVEVDAVMAQYRGLIVLLGYDMATPTASLETSSHAELRKAMVLAGLVGVKHAPYFLFVDRYGRIVGRHAGFIDRSLLEREVLRATG